jgi:hypothetical protein
MRRAVENLRDIGGTLGDSMYRRAEASGHLPTSQDTLDKDGNVIPGGNLARPKRTGPAFELPYDNPGSEGYYLRKVYEEGNDGTKVVGLVYGSDSGVTGMVSGSLEVYMTNSEPGVYYSRNGTEVSEEIAARAGFDVDALRDKRRRMEIDSRSRKAVADMSRDQRAANVAQLVVLQEPTPLPKNEAKIAELRALTKRIAATVELERNALALQRAKVDAKTGEGGG